MSSPNTPPIELDTFWPYQIAVLADQVSRYTRDVARTEAGLNLSQWRVLAAVAERPGRASKDVTAITPMDKTIVSRAVATLIDAGLIEKKTDAADRRLISLHATSSGLKIYAKIANYLNTAMVDAFKDGIPPEDFVQIIKAFSQKMNTLTGAP